MIKFFCTTIIFDSKFPYFDADIVEADCHVIAVQCDIAAKISLKTEHNNNCHLPGDLESVDDVWTETIKFVYNIKNGLRFYGKQSFPLYSLFIERLLGMDCAYENSRYQTNCSRLSTEVSHVKTYV